MRDGELATMLVEEFPGESLDQPLLTVGRFYAKFEKRLSTAFGAQRDAGVLRRARILCRIP